MAILSTKQWDTLQSQKIKNQVGPKNPPVIDEVKQPLEKKIQSDSEDTVYAAYHPDDPFRQMNTKIQLKIGGQDVSIEIVNGKVETNKRIIFDELIKRGWLAAANYDGQKLSPLDRRYNSGRKGIFG